MWLYREGKHTQAEKMLKRAIDTDGSFVPALADYACLTHRLHREYQVACDLYERVLNQEPCHLPTLCNRCVLCCDASSLSAPKPE